MKKAITILYGINTILFLVGIPLSIWLAYIWFKAGINYKADDPAEAVAGTFVLVIIGALIIGAALIVSIFDFISFLIALRGFTKVRKATSKKGLRRIGIVSIIFIGNIIPGILLLLSKNSDYNKNELESGDNNENDDEKIEEK